MFLKLRSHHIKIILWFLIIVIVPAFVLWGSASLRNRKQSVVASIAGKEMTLPEFDKYMKMSKLFLLLNAAPQANITYKDIERTAFELMVLLWKADKENIEISDARLADYIIHNFSTRDGFDQKHYEFFIKNLSQKYNLGLTPRIFEEYIRNFIKLADLFERNIDVDLDQQQLRQLYNRENQTAKIAHIFIPYENFQINAESTLDEAKEFYEKNKGVFREKEKVKIKYVIIDDQKKAEDVTAYLPQTGNIEDLASKYSLVITESDFISRDDPLEKLGWQPAINNTAFSMAEGELSPLVETSRGKVVLQKIASKPASVPAFEAIEDKVKQKLVSVRSREDAKRFADKLLNEIKDKEPTDLKTIASKHGLDYKETDYFKYNDYIEGLGMDKEISELIFEMEKGEFYQEPVPKEKGIYIIKMVDKKIPGEEEFQKEKQEFSKKIRLSKELAAKMQFLQNTVRESGLEIYSRQDQ